MRLQIHNVVKIEINKIKEFTRENGNASHVDFKMRDVFITDKNGVVFTIELFFDNADLVLTT